MKFRKYEEAYKSMNLLMQAHSSKQKLLNSSQTEFSKCEDNHPTENMEGIEKALLNGLLNMALLASWYEDYKRIEEIIRDGSSESEIYAEVKFNNSEYYLTAAAKKALKKITTLSDAELMRDLLEKSIEQNIKLIQDKPFLEKEKVNKTIRHLRNLAS